MFILLKAAVELFSLFLIRLIIRHTYRVLAPKVSSAHIEAAMLSHVLSPGPTALADKFDEFRQSRS